MLRLYSAAGKQVLASTWFDSTTVSQVYRDCLQFFRVDAGVIPWNKPWLLHSYHYQTCHSTLHELWWWQSVAKQIKKSNRFTERSMGRRQ